ncbi:MAG TPA: hypothetical protein VNT79_00165 [Phycisphaerae bacterium]|nr:hypothetical protein [Phycisphaerae bacterium]
MNTTPHENLAAQPSSPSLRAFCHTTGYIFQSIGFMLAMAMCCWWPSNCWQDQIRPATTAAATEPPQPLRDAAPHEVWAMVAVTASFVGGLSLLVIGFGLQQDRLRSGIVPMLVTGAITAFFWLYLGFAIFQFPAVGRIIVSALMALAWTICFLLAGVCNEQLRANPPTRSERSWTSRDEDDFRKSLSPDSPDKTNP